LCSLSGLKALTTLLSLLNTDAIELRQWLLENWCLRAGKRNPEVSASHYRLRQAIQRLWASYPPPGLPMLNTGCIMKSVF
jgi:hypothetical protein